MSTFISWQRCLGRRRDAALQERSQCELKTLSASCRGSASEEKQLLQRLHHTEQSEGTGGQRDLNFRSKLHGSIRTADHLDCVDVQQNDIQ